MKPRYTIIAEYGDIDTLGWDVSVVRNEPIKSRGKIAYGGPDNPLKRFPFEVWVSLLGGDNGTIIQQGCRDERDAELWADFFSVQMEKGYDPWVVVHNCKSEEEAAQWRERFKAVDGQYQAEAPGTGSKQ